MSIIFVYSNDKTDMILEKFYSLRLGYIRILFKSELSNGKYLL